MKIIKNAIKTPDGTIIESKHRHDFVCHIDKITNKKYCIDGGLDYLRRVTEGDDYEDVSISTDENDHLMLREHLKWGQNYDKDNNRLPETIYRPIKDMKTDHIESIISGNWCNSFLYLNTFKKELKLRESDISFEPKSDY
jgi:hypothetical protein